MNINFNNLRKRGINFTETYYDWDVKDYVTVNIKDHGTVKWIMERYNIPVEVARLLDIYQQFVFKDTNFKYGIDEQGDLIGPHYTELRIETNDERIIRIHKEIELIKEYLKQNHKIKYNNCLNIEVIKNEDYPSNKLEELIDTSDLITAEKLKRKI